MAGFNTLRGLSESQLSEAAGGLTLEEIGENIKNPSANDISVSIEEYDFKRIVSWSGVEGATSYFVMKNDTLLEETTDTSISEELSVSSVDRYVVHASDGSEIIARSGVHRSQPAGNVLTTTPGLVAFWDFNDVNDLSTAAGRESFTLTRVGGSISRTTDENSPFGGYINLDGGTYLKINPEDVGDLHVGAKTGKCTVIGWVRRNNTGGGFVAGCWRENNNNPGRSYGLFVDLSLYGGADRVCGHVNRYGGATPGYPYSISYSSSRNAIPAYSFGSWDMVAFTYDGTFARSYLNDKFSEYSNFTDLNGNTYDKNPYFYPDGLNPTLETEFTVGAVELTEGFGNFFEGSIAGVAVYDRALSYDEIREIYRSTVPPMKSGVSMTSAGSDVGVGYFGMNSYYDTTAIDTSLEGIVGNWIGALVDGFGYSAISERDPSKISVITQTGLSISSWNRITAITNNSSTSDTVRLCVQIDDNWYATDEQFAADEPGSASTWSTTEKRMTANLKTSIFRELVINPGVELSLGQSTPLPMGTMTGVGVFSDGPTDVIRLRRIEVE